MFWSVVERFTKCQTSYGANYMGCGKNHENFQNNKVEVNKKQETNMFLIVLVVYILILFVLAPWLWNNVLCRLVPVMKKSEWYDMFLLALLLSILLPARM